MYQKLSRYAAVPLRFGVGFVFFYFGFLKYRYPQQNIAQFLDMGVPTGIAPAINFIFGAVEILIALAMFSGLLVRYAAAVASFLLILILGGFTLKYGRFGFDAVFRDLAVLGATLSLALRVGEKK
ncbi:MAG: DoxX family membrane protein [Parcubacteria group bacterium]|nr:DoxX family membrane protein [Parcubacteria group bacterium]